MENRFNDNLLLLKGMLEALQAASGMAYKDANDDSCRAIYKDMTASSRDFLEEIQHEIDSHKAKGKWL